MNIRQLETFYWIARQGTFGGAAERLFTSQANVSARIRELEGELEVELFDRIGRNVQLTLKGRELLVHATKVVAAAAQLRMAAGRRQLVQGLVKIGLGEVIAMRSLVSMMGELKRLCPGMDIEFEVDVNARLLQRLARGGIDIAVIGGPVDDPEISLLPIGAMDMLWVSAPRLLEGRNVLSPIDLTDLPIISLSRESQSYHLLQSWFLRAGVTPTVVSYCNNLSILGQVVCAGECAALMPAMTVEREIEAGTLRVLEVEPAPSRLPFFVATRVGSIDPMIPEIAHAVGNLARLPEADERANST